MACSESVLTFGRVPLAGYQPGATCTYTEQQLNTQKRGKRPRIELDLNPVAALSREATVIGTKYH
jgi:hypothetical protein